MSDTEYYTEISIAHRIKELRSAGGLTQKTFADSLGIVQGYLSGIERGKKIPSRTLLMAICHVYGVREEWLCGGNGAKFAEKRQSEEQFSAAAMPRIPLLREIPEGFPDRMRTEDIRGHICLPDIHEGCFAIVAEGDFMAPTIRDGDLVIFRPGDEVDNRSIVLMSNRWGEVILRRCRIKGDAVYFSPENASYAPFKADTDTRIFGTVISIWRNVKT